MKAGLQLNLKKTEVISTEDIREFKVDDEDVEVVERFVFLGSLIHRENHCSQDIRRRLALGRTAICRSWRQSGGTNMSLLGRK